MFTRCVTAVVNRLMIAVVFAVFALDVHADEPPLLNVSEVEFVTADTARLVFETEFPAGQNSVEFKINVTGETLFDATHSVSLRSSDDLSEEELLSYSLSPGTIRTFRLNRANQGAAATIRLSYITAKAAVAPRYLLVVKPLLSELDVPLQMQVAVLNNTPSAWGINRGGMPIVSVSGSGGSPGSPLFSEPVLFGSVPANGSIAVKRAAYDGGSVEHRLVVDSDAIPPSSADQPTIVHPELLVRVGDWPKGLDCPGPIEFRLAGQSRPPVIVNIDASPQQTANESFRNNRTAFVPLGAVPEIGITRTEFEYNFAISAGFLHWYQVRQTVFQADWNDGDIPIDYLNAGSWLFVSDDGSCLACSGRPRNYDDEPLFLKGEHTVLIEKRPAVPQALTLGNRFRLQDRVSERLTRLASLLELSADSDLYFGPPNAGDEERQWVVYQVNQVHEALLRLSDFAAAASARIDAINVEIRSVLTAAAFPATFTVRHQKEIDAQIRTLRAERRQLEASMDEVVKCFDHSLATFTPACPDALKAFHDCLNAATKVVE